MIQSIDDKITLRGVKKKPFFIFLLPICEAAVYFLPRNPILSTFLAFLILLAPGLALLLKFSLITRRNFQNISLSLLLSILYLEVGFTLFQFMAKSIGVGHPISLLPVHIFFGGTLIVSGRIFDQYIDSTLCIERLFKGDFLQITLFRHLLPCTFPLLSFIVVSRLNRFHDQSSIRLLLYFFMSYYLLLFFGLTIPKSSSLTRVFYFQFFCLNLAMLLLTSLRGEIFWGFDINTEFAVAEKTLSLQYWSPPGSQGSAYFAMLSITVLPAILSIVLKLSVLSIFHLFYPVIAAMIPIIIYEMVQQLVGHRLAFFVTFTMLVCSISYFAEMVALSRQVVGLAFFAQMVSLIFSGEPAVAKRRVLFLLFGLGLSCSHYSSAYLAAFLFILAGLVNLRIGMKGVPPRRFLNFTLALSFLVTVTLYNGVFTHSLQDTRAQYQQFQQQGAKLLPQKQGNFVNRWLNGVKNVQDVLPASYKIQVVGNDLNSFPEKKTSLVGLASDITPTNFAETKLQFGSVFAKIMVWSYIVSNSSIQICIVFSLIFFLVLVRFRFPKKLIKCWKKNLTGEDKVYEDAIPLLIIGLCLAILLRISGTIGAFYNPQRAAFQLAFIFAIPLAFFLRYLSKVFVKRIRPLFFLAVLFSSLLFHQSSALSTYFTGDLSSRISNATGNSYPFVSKKGSESAANFLAKFAKEDSAVNSDVHGTLAVSANYRISTKRSFSQIAPFGIFEDSYVILSNSNLKTGVAEGINLKVTNGLIFHVVPFDYYDKYLDVVYSSGESRVYR
jgi:uncharacterized membrane protein